MRRPPLPSRPSHSTTLSRICDTNGPGFAAFRTKRRRLNLPAIELTCAASSTKAPLAAILAYTNLGFGGFPKQPEERSHRNLSQTSFYLASLTSAAGGFEGRGL